MKLIKCNQSVAPICHFSRNGMCRLLAKADYEEGKCAWFKTDADFEKGERKYPFNPFYGAERNEVKADESTQ